MLREWERIGGKGLGGNRGRARKGRKGERKEGKRARERSREVLDTSPSLSTTILFCQFPVL